MSSPPPLPGGAARSSHSQFRREALSWPSLQPLTGPHFAQTSLPSRGDPHLSLMLFLAGSKGGARAPQEPGRALQATQGCSAGAPGAQIPLQCMQGAVCPSHTAVVAAPPKQPDCPWQWSRVEVSCSLTLSAAADAFASDPPVRLSACSPLQPQLCKAKGTACLMLLAWAEAGNGHQGARVAGACLAISPTRAPARGPALRCKGTVSVARRARLSSLSLPGLVTLQSWATVRSVSGLKSSGRWMGSPTGAR